MKTEDLDYHIPDSLIASTPAINRDQSRLMILNRQGDLKKHSLFNDIINHLPNDALLVFNDTKVMSCRFFGKKESGAKLELFLLSEETPQTWKAITRCSSKIKEGDILCLEDTEKAVTVKKNLDGGERLVSFANDVDVYKLMEKSGHTPLPPYIEREDEVEDKTRYQTVYANNIGAVAAPTAGLHFTNNLLEAIKERGIGTASVTLHTGIGTFRPIKADNIEEHPMHSEKYQINEENAQKIQNAVENNRPIIAVGTTSVRTLESVWRDHQKIIACKNSTDIYLYPPYTPKIVNGLITNFHLPKSTLLLLVSCFIPLKNLLSAYEIAVNEKYRFYSYGDAMYIGP